MLLLPYVFLHELDFNELYCTNTRASSKYCTYILSALLGAYASNSPSFCSNIKKSDCKGESPFLLRAAMSTYCKNQQKELFLQTFFYENKDIVLEVTHKIHILICIHIFEVKIAE